MIAACLCETYEDSLLNIFPLEEFLVGVRKFCHFLYNPLFSEVLLRFILFVGLNKSVSLV